MQRLSVIGMRGMSQLKRTALFEYQSSLSPKMVPFAGWEMAVEFKDGAKSGMLVEHHQTRTAASLFDVSHMLQLKLHGKDRVKFLEGLVVGDLQGLKQGQALLSLMTNEKGGIIDDTVISSYSDHIYQVCNAGCADKDLAHITSQLNLFLQKNPSADVSLQVIQDHSLLALQGPLASKVLQGMVSDNLSKMSFMNGSMMKVNIGGNEKVECLVTRCGYTGEDGFEISVPSNRAVALAEAFIKNEDVKWAGLGARDSLRLEAGLCLYGNDIDETTTPIEASLLWCIGKRRKEQGGFLGAEQVLSQLKGGKNFPPKMKRVGLIVEAGAPARGGYAILDKEGKEIGKVTSGCPSPSLSKNIAMGYVPYELSNLETEVLVGVRKSQRKAIVSKMPFTEARYFRASN